MFVRYEVRLQIFEESAESGGIRILVLVHPFSDGGGEVLYTCFSCLDGLIAIHFE